MNLSLRVLNLSFQILSGGKTWEIMDDTFSGLRMLEILDITAEVKKNRSSRPYRNILKFHGSPFQLTQSLKSLYLGGNAINGLTSLTFSGLEQLQILDMSYTSTSFDLLPKYLFQDLRGLKT